MEKLQEAKRRKALTKEQRIKENNARCSLKVISIKYFKRKGVDKHLIPKLIELKMQLLQIEREIKNEKCK